MNHKQFHIPSITPEIFSRTSLSKNLRTFNPISVRTPSLVLSLCLASLRIMLSAVKLYHEIGLGTVKINDVLPDNLLPFSKGGLQGRAWNFGALNFFLSGLCPCSFPSVLCLLYRGKTGVLMICRRRSPITLTQ